MKIHFEKTTLIRAIVFLSIMSQSFLSTLGCLSFNTGEICVENVTLHSPETLFSLNLVAVIRGESRIDSFQGCQKVNTTCKLILIIRLFFLLLTCLLYFHSSMLLRSITLLMECCRVRVVICLLCKQLCCSFR